MKKYIIIIAAAIGFSGGNLLAQDVTLTNAKMERPSGNNEYGNACFTLIAEDGLAITSVPLAVEISLSKVAFDVSGINGFNSDLFMWEVDGFASNVVRGTLISAIPGVDENGGGAQVCIPVKRDFVEEYEESRNGFLVNVVPGSVDQGGNSGADAASRFGFSNTQNSNVNKGSGAKTLNENDNISFQIVSIYPNPAKDVFTFTTSVKGFGSLSIFDANGNRLVSGKKVVSGDRIDVQSFTAGVYHAVYTGENQQESISERLIVFK